MDLHTIYLKQDTFVCGSEMCLWNVFLFMDLFYIYTYQYPFVCALKCICEKRRSSCCYLADYVCPAKLVEAYSAWPPAARSYIYIRIAEGKSFR